MAKFSTRLGLAAGILIVCGSGAVHSADMPVKAAPVMPAFYNWTGIYVGAHAGYGTGMKDWTASIFDYDVKGFLAGGQIGANQQIGNWVIGIEADASWSNIRGSQAITIGGPLLGFTQSATATTNVDRIVTVAGRLGFAQDRGLVYLKAGGAWVHENHNFTALQTATVPGAAPVTQTAAGAASENRFGPMVGFGAEYALWGNWSFKSEYNYLHMPSARVRLVGTITNLGVTTPFAADTNIEQAFHLVKFGLNYRFGPDAPPVIAPARPVPGFNWTGFYAGAQAAYGFGRKEWEGFAPNGRFDVSGGLAGGVTGTNVQAGVFVVGVESEWMWSGIKGSNRFAETFAGIGTQTTDLATKIEWLSLNSMRFGFVAADRWLVYFKGGVALARESHTLGQSVVLTGVGSLVANLTGSALHTGYLAGIGVEHAFLGNWSAKLEYNYVDFRPQNSTGVGTQAINVPGTVGAIADARRISINQEMHLVKLGVNYHFQAMPDVIRAKY